MSVLTDHRTRVATLAETLETLQKMHDLLHELWGRVARIRPDGTQERKEQLDQLHDEAYALAGRIAQLREETFGEMPRDAALRISSVVESIHPSLLNPLTVVPDGP